VKSTTRKVKVPMEEQEKMFQAKLDDLPIKGPNIFQRINAVMKEVDYIQKDQTKKVAGQYKFVSHDQVTAALHGPMTKHGIVCIPTIEEMKQDGNRTQVQLTVSFVNIDNPEWDRFSVTYYGYGIDTSDKGIGKAVSYAFKYALLKTFCLETGDDPDQDQSTKYEPKKEAPPEPAKMSATQVKVLVEAIGPDIELYQKILNFLKKLGCSCIEDTPAEKFDGLLKYINGQKVKAHSPENGQMTIIQGGQMIRLDAEAE
jgi:hypothetical protein